jgi:hypothetical protein
VNTDFLVLFVALNAWRGLTLHGPWIAIALASLATLPTANLTRHNAPTLRHQHTDSKAMEGDRCIQ